MSNDLELEPSDKSIGQIESLAMTGLFTTALQCVVQAIGKKVRETSNCVVQGNLFVSFLRDREVCESHEDMQPFT